MGKWSEALRQRVLRWLSEHVPESRLQHILRVEEMAAELAQTHNLAQAQYIDPEAAAQAGLMHDLAKYFKPQRLLEIAHQEGLVLDPVDEANPHLLHANVSAIVARDQFGITDSSILAAIANHTLGHPGMDALSCIIFLADSLEPGRGNTPQLQCLRKISQQNLYQAVWMTADYTIQHLLETRRLVHPRAILTRNWFLQQPNSQRIPVKAVMANSPESADASPTDACRRSTFSSPS